MNDPVASLYVHTYAAPQIDILHDSAGVPYGVLTIPLSETASATLFIHDPNREHGLKNLLAIADHINAAYQDFMDPHRNERGRLEDGNAKAA